ncbi:DUF6381 family protein [Streptomyces sp. NPDC056670]|uniref:DUF6381 family protein n=1 Tax=Streptomyces sp. NPDC056670 TaxID=3345904 RepID=UPI0036A1B4CA
MDTTRPTDDSLTQQVRVQVRELTLAAERTSDLELRRRLTEKVRRLQRRYDQALKTTG